MWRVWSVKNDVYVAPRKKGGDFRISLHESGQWRLGFTKEYGDKMVALGSWDQDRKVESIKRPPDIRTDSRAPIASTSSILNSASLATNRPPT